MKQKIWVVQVGEFEPVAPQGAQAGGNWSVFCTRARVMMETFMLLLQRKDQRLPTATVPKKPRSPSEWAAMAERATGAAKVARAAEAQKKGRKLPPKRGRA